jgi:hypothetical protein
MHKRWHPLHFEEMTKKILIVILMLGTISCSRREGEQKTGLLSYFVSITDSEDKGIKEILDFYGGQCKYSFGAVASTNDKEDKKYFKIQLMKSVVVTKYDDRPEWTTSNIAYIFYKNLNQKERENYSHIRATLVFDNGDKIEHDYSRKELETVEKKMKTINKIIEIIKQKRFDDIKSYLNPENNFSYDKDEVISGLKKYDPEFGNITEFRLFGFKYTTADTKPILSIFGIIIRDIQNNEFKVYLNPKSDKEEIMGLDYKW